MTNPMTNKLTLVLRKHKNTHRKKLKPNHYQQVLVYL